MLGQRRPCSDWVTRKDAPGRPDQLGCAERHLVSARAKLATRSAGQDAAVTLTGLAIAEPPRRHCPSELSGTKPVLETAPACLLARAAVCARAPSTRSGKRAALATLSLARAGLSIQPTPTKLKTQTHNTPTSAPRIRAPPPALQPLLSRTRRGSRAAAGGCPHRRRANALGCSCAAALLQCSAACCCCCCCQGCGCCCCCQGCCQGCQGCGCCCCQGC